MLIIALLSGMLMFLIFLLLIEYFTRGKNKITRKVRRYSGELAALNHVEKRPDYLATLMKFIRYFSLKMQGTAPSKNLEAKMQQAGLPILGSEFLVLVAGIMLAAGALSLALTFKIVLSASVGMLAGAGCFIYLTLRIANRQKAFNNQLGDVLVMIANSMRSGFSFMQAMDLIAKEMKPPVSMEFFKTIAEIRLGSDVETALLNLGKRVQSPDLDLVITAVLIQREVGGNLAQILDNIAETINERIKMKREIKTLTAQGRLSGWILAALPVVLAVFAAIVNPAYMRPFIDDPLGRVILAAAVIAELIGFLLIRRIVNIDV